MVPSRHLQPVYPVEYHFLSLEAPDYDSSPEAWQDRPISLLCTPSKVFEKLILDKVFPLFPICSFQHGFKAPHSTSTLLTTVSQSVLDGLNHSKLALRSLVAAIDISKAFDTVPRYKLVSKILDT